MRRHNFTMQYQWLFICSNKRYEWHLVFTETICNFYHYFHAFTPPAKYWMQHKHEWEVANEKGHCDNQFSSVQSLSPVWLFVTPWMAARQASLSFTNSWSLLKLISIESMMPSNHLILCHPLLLSSVFPNIKVLSSESALCIRWPKYWIFSFSFNPSHEYSWLISFRIDWFDLLAVQGTLKSLLQHHSSKHQFFGTQHFFMGQHSHPFMTNGKTVVLTR